MQTATRSWVNVPADSDFPLENLPYGVFTTPDREPRIGVAIGEHILDLRAASEAGMFDRILARDVLESASLNLLLGAGRAAWTALRRTVTELLREGGSAPQGDRDRWLVRQADATMLLPFHPGDYVDFYSSIEHATNLGKIFRPDGEPLMPNWRWIPIGYHGRSSTIVVDGTPVVRPRGQRKPPSAQTPTFGPSTMLDIELEVGFVTGPGNRMGTSIPVGAAADHIFGVVLVNDWSARDIQAWEYQPLGPFLGKSFATSISPWVVTLDALEPYRVAGPAQDPQPLEYLRCSDPWNFDVDLAVELQTQRMRDKGIGPVAVSHANFKLMYWNMAQQLAHATANGTAVRPGDLYASGTISGTEPDSCGSFIELTWRGTKPLELPSGETRSFLEDGDTVTLRGRAQAQGKPRIGFGSVSGTIVKAQE